MPGKADERLVARLRRICMALPEANERLSLLPAAVRGIRRLGRGRARHEARLDMVAALVREAYLRVATDTLRAVLREVEAER